jgi:hypothetical protein
MDRDVRHFLVFDSECVSCSRVAHAVRSLGVRGLDVKPSNDPELRAALARFGRTVPDGPALVSVNGDRIRCRTGLLMRIQLARLIGYRRSRDMIRLLALETQARGERDGMSRRRLLGGAVAAAGLAIAGSAIPAYGKPSGQGTRPATSAEHDRVLALPDVQQASSQWGKVNETGLMVLTDDGGTEVVALPHTGSNAVTYVENTATSPAVVTILVAGQQMRFYLPDGTPVVTAAVDDDGTLTIAPAVPDVEPDGKKEFAACMVTCLSAHLDASCVVSCIGCAGSPVSCVACALCAGPKGVTCVKHCKHFL